MTCTAAWAVAGTSSGQLRELDDEPGASAGTVFHPHRASVRADVLSDHRKPKSTAVVIAAVPGACAAGEPLENPLA